MQNAGPKMPVLKDFECQFYVKTAQTLKGDFRKIMWLQIRRGNCITRKFYVSQEWQHVSCKMTWNWATLTKRYFKYSMRCFSWCIKIEIIFQHISSCCLSLFWMYIIGLEIYFKQAVVKKYNWHYSETGSSKYLFFMKL